MNDDDEVEGEVPDVFANHHVHGHEKTQSRIQWIDYILQILSLIIVQFEG